MGNLPEWLLNLLISLDWGSIGRLTLAAFLGGIVGAEREISGHPAGLRTNILISTSACLFTLLSIKAFPMTGASQDTARVAAQIVTGVGFLGAGAVIQTKRAVHGLTTAATIWLIAAVGMACGTDQYGLGIVTTILTTVVLVLLGPLSARLSHIAEKQHQRDKRNRRSTDNPDMPEAPDRSI